MLDVVTTSDGRRQIASVADFIDYSAATVPPVPMGSYTALSIPAYKRAITILCDTLASFPRRVHLNGAKPADPHPLARILKSKPNTYQNPVLFWRHLFYSAVHTGNGYARIEREILPGFLASEPIGLHNLNPDDIHPFRYHPPIADGRPIRSPSQWYAHWPTMTAFPAADIVHLAGLSHDGMSGVDPVSLHAETFQRAATLERYQTKFLRSGSFIRGAIEVPGPLSDDKIKQFREILKKFRGDTGEGAEDILLLPQQAKLNNVTISPEDSQLVEQTSVVTKAIAQATGVAPELLFELSEAKYNKSAEQAGQILVRYTLRPWLIQAEAELTAKLLSEREQEDGYTVSLNPDALLRGDTKAVADTVIATVKAGVRTRNEGRELLDLPRDENPESDRLQALGETGAAAGGSEPTKAETESTQAAGTSESSEGGESGQRSAERKPRRAIDLPEEGEADRSGPTRLNGYHATATIEVLDKLAKGTLTKLAAVAIIASMGMKRSDAEAACEDTIRAARAAGGHQTGGSLSYSESIILPVLRAACDRVDQKTEKAFANAANRTGQDRTVWVNTFAEQQRRYAAEALQPVNDTIVAMRGDGLDVNKIAELYASQVRHRGATGSGKTLFEVAFGREPATEEGASHG